MFQSELTSALCTSASQLAALVWVARHCHNPGRSRDTQGRTLAHVAAATGQTEVAPAVISNTYCLRVRCRCWSGCCSAGRRSSTARTRSPATARYTAPPSTASSAPSSGCCRWRTEKYLERSKNIFHAQHGANMQLLDQDGLTCLDHAVLDRPLHVSYDVTAPLDAYVWGTNSNFNLGLGNNTNRWHSSGDIV